VALDYLEFDDLPEAEIERWGEALNATNRRELSGVTYFTDRTMSVIYPVLEDASIRRTQAGNSRNSSALASSILASG
jgi:hypothetical protein